MGLFPLGGAGAELSEGWGLADAGEGIWHLLPPGGSSAKPAQGRGMEAGEGGVTGCGSSVGHCTDTRGCAFTTPFYFKCPPPFLQHSPCASPDSTKRVSALSPGPEGSRRLPPLRPLCYWINQR
ncbi:Creatine kinase B-type [Platysternon megacephalum]|uniref:Creatine kinase B-type n=1 Tax=Platysternon megacephalum TaxID=55544 RepID=A0A4D9DLF9_9SAUR|nr:Creatine kinase B-type [Platysternon megacephalum]